LFADEVSHVRVALDIHDRSLDVQVGPLAGSRAPDGARLPDGTRAQFPLWLLLWVKTADEARARSLSEYADESELGVRAALEANSQALGEAASDVLAGDLPFLAVPIWRIPHESRRTSPADLGPPRCKLTASGPPAVEGDGWVNWSGLATLAARIDDRLIRPLDRLLITHKAQSTQGAKSATIPSSAPRSRLLPILPKLQETTESPRQASAPRRRIA